MYFLYRNTTAGASDANGGKNQLIISNLAELCGSSNNSYALFDDLSTAVAMKVNVSSSYMYASVVFALALMVGMLGFLVIFVSCFLKEHQIPLIFRQADGSLYSDIQRAKNFFFMVFIVLTGVPAQLNFYVVNDSCLHTVSDDYLPAGTVDLY